MKFEVNLFPFGHSLFPKDFFKNYTFETVTIHWTGTQYRQTPNVVRNWWLSQNNGIGAHFIIKDEHCLQCLPVHAITSHCGSATGNRTSIGVEIIPENPEGKFSDKSIQTVKELLSLFPPKHIVRHYDWSGKDCPRYYLDEKLWEQLKLAITPDSW